MIQQVNLSGAMGPMMAMLTPDLVNAVVVDVADAARAKWVALAQSRLNTTAAAYAAGIQNVNVRVLGGTVIATVVLVGKIPNMVELGMDPYDMRDTLLGPNVPVASPGGRGKHRALDGGYYRAIPFRIGAPGATGLPTIARIYQKKLGKEAALALGKAVHQAAKRLEGSRSSPGTRTAWGGRLPSGTGGIAKLKRHHKTDIAAGLTKFEQKYDKATQVSYGTFRTISTNETTGWHHPGLKPRDLASQVSRYANRIAPRLVEQAVKEYIRSLR